MSNFYVVSTINNIKNTKLFKKDNGNFVELENNAGQKIYLYKGQYAVFSTFSANYEIQAVISKEFFKDNFDIVGRTFLKFTHKNGCEETKFVGVLCTTKDKKEKDND